MSKIQISTIWNLRWKFDIYSNKYIILTINSNKNIINDSIISNKEENSNELRRLQSYCIILHCYITLLCCIILNGNEALKLSAAGGNVCNL